MIRFGESIAQASARAVIARLRSDPAIEAKRLAAVRAANRRAVGGAGGASNRAKTSCPRGHRYTDANTYRLGGRRYCRACGVIRKGQQRWRRDVVEPRLEAARVALIAAHPDHGGSRKAFAEALRVYRRLKAEAA
jgi:hypothetical protein